MIVTATAYTHRHTQKTEKVDDELIAQFNHQTNQLYKINTNLIIDGSSYEFFDFIEGEWVLYQISTSIPQVQPSEHLIAYITKSQMFIKDGHKILLIKDIKPNFEVITDIMLNLGKTESGLWLISLSSEGGDYE